MSLHSTGQARVRLSGKAHYLGAWGSPEAHEAYSKLIRDWLANGKQPLGPAPVTVTQATLSVADLNQQYRVWLDATGRYAKRGLANGHRRVVNLALSSFEAFAGAVPVRKLTAGLLVQWRDRIEAEHPNMVRRSINVRVGVMQRVLAWGWERDLVPRTVLTDCSAVKPLRRGSCGPRPERGRPRRCVSAEDLQAVAAHCSVQVRAMMDLQLATGMRPGEVCSVRWCDINRDGPDGTWIYTVDNGKTEHHDRKVRYLLGAAAQRIVLAQPMALPTAPIFPAPRLRGPWKVVCYTQHLHDACVKAGVQRFSAHELRHTALTRVCEQAGIAAACAAASHSDMATTSRYLHRDDAQALRAVAVLDQRASG